MRYRRRREGGDWSKEGRRGSGNESRKVCRDPFERRMRQRERERMVLEERTRRIHLLDPDSRRWSPAGIRGVPSSRLLLHFRPPAVFIHSLRRRTPFRRLSFIITRPIIEAIIIEIYHAPRGEGDRGRSPGFLTNSGFSLSPSTKISSIIQEGVDKYGRHHLGNLRDFLLLAFKRGEDEVKKFSVSGFQSWPSYVDQRFWKIRAFEARRTVTTNFIKAWESPLQEVIKAASANLLTRRGLELNSGSV